MMGPEQLQNRIIPIHGCAEVDACLQYGFFLNGVLGEAVLVTDPHFRVWGIIRHKPDLCELQVMTAAATTRIGCHDEHAIPCKTPRSGAVATADFRQESNPPILRG